LLYGDTKQFLVQVMGAVICAAWAFGATFIEFKGVNAVKSMRVSKEVEREGLDVPEFGLQGYPEDVVHATEFVCFRQRCGCSVSGIGQSGYVQ
jgi:Amt family ammonium transporter